MTALASSTQELVVRFRDAAIRKGKGNFPARVDHELHRAMSEAFWALEEQGQPGREAFRSLLLDESPEVRSWVAAQLLSEGESGARFTLEQLRREHGMLGLDAEAVLREHASGRLESPFGKRGA